MIRNSETFISLLDTQRFGFKVAKINEFPGAPQHICDHMKTSGVKLIISKIKIRPGDNTIEKLEDVGFRVKDIQLKYWYDLTRLDFNHHRESPGFIIREAVPEDLPYLEAIAAEAFRGYGHYAADTRLDQEKCLEIYIDWTRRSCLDKNVADKIFLAEKDDRIVGFQAFKIQEENGGKNAVGVLGAISTAFRGIGIFPELVRRGSVWGSGLNLKWQEHKVLTTNYPVNRSLAKIGFRIVDSIMTMHCWL